MIEASSRRIGPDLVLGLAELIAVSARFGTEGDTGDRRDHSRDSGHDGERGRVGCDAHRACGERRQSAGNGDDEARILH